jgi:hypothetical protein
LSFSWSFAPPILLGAIAEVFVRDEFGNPHQGSHPAAVLDDFMPFALPARERTIVGACMTAVDNGDRRAAAA